MADDLHLARRLGTADAVMIGLGSMIGAGVFSAFAPAAAAAGAGVLVGLLLAAVVAYEVVRRKAEEAETRAMSRQKPIATNVQATPAAAS